MTVSAIKCDICGAVKGEANKWLKGYVDHNGRGLYVCAAHVIGDEPGLDLCSDTCLQKKLGEVLAAIRTEPERGEARPPDGGIASNIAVVCKNEEVNA